MNPEYLPYMESKAENGLDMSFTHAREEHIIHGWSGDYLMNSYKRLKLRLEIEKLSLF